MKETKDTSERSWSDRSILKAIKNPSPEAYEIKHESSELTFLGVPKQPDFATVLITVYPRDTVIELRSLKEYFGSFRSVVISYERLANVIYDDLKAVYDPVRLRIKLITATRGGLRSRVVIDSDWKVRGGQEAFRDWIGQSDE